VVKLTPRQREVLELLAEGHQQDEIARQLTLSVNTVHRHCAEIFIRLGAANAVAAVAVGLRKGLIR
jgi:DNA-binding NarL/FixJ family response regulator